MMQVKCRKVSGPTIEPISLAQARTYLRIDVPGYSGDTMQDELLQMWISAARRACELRLEKVIGAQDWLVTCPSFASLYRHHYPHHERPWLTGLTIPATASLPVRPVRSVEGVFYLDTNGDYIEVDAASYRLVDGDGRLILNDGYSWPDLAVVAPDAVHIELTAGMALPDETDIDVEVVEQDVMSAMRLMLGHLWTNRSAVVDAGSALAELPLGFDALLWPNRAGIGLG